MVHISMAIVLLIICVKNLSYDFIIINENPLHIIDILYLRILNIEKSLETSLALCGKNLTEP